MRSRYPTILFAIVLSVQLVVSSTAEALQPIDSLASESLPIAPSAVGASDLPDERPSAAQQRKKREAQPRAKKAKQQNAKRQKAKRQKAERQNPNAGPRSTRRPAGRSQLAGGPGPTSVPRLEGGPLRGAEQQLALVADPGERYIVVYADQQENSRALTTAIDSQPGVIPTNLYEHGVRGFAGFLTPAAKAALERDPRVSSIQPDRKRFTTAQTLPRGINRVDADLNPVAGIDGGGPGVNVDIAIIDTGADLEHPDLNIHAYIDCTFDPDFEGYDMDGHGTHVAGTAAAIDNGIGVVGVAPGARIWSLRVEDDNGDMFDSYIIDCMDSVTFYANTPFLGHTIDVANMSLGAPSTPDADDCADDAFNLAVCRMVNAGVTTVVAAGNNARDAGTFNPANMDEVITVSALADSDGLPGGQGGNFNASCQAAQVDEGLATFSNFGADVDIAAPGIDVLSTYPTYRNPSCTSPIGVGYDVLAGTSMASPHVAGAAGLLLAVSPNLTPVQVKAALRANREQVAIARDPDGINEGILNLTPSSGGGGGDKIPPTVSMSAPGTARVGQRISIRVSASDRSGIARVVLYQCQPGCRKVAQDATAPYRFVRGHNQPGRVRYKVRVWDLAGNVSEKTKIINVRPKR